MKTNQWTTTLSVLSNGFFLLGLCVLFFAYAFLSEGGGASKGGPKGHKKNA